MRRLAASVFLILFTLASFGHATADNVLFQTVGRTSDKVVKRTYWINRGPATVMLSSQPISCVTLRQGQPCYIRLEVTWEADAPITACLTSSSSEAGACWENEQTGDFEVNLYLSETTEWVMQDSSGHRLGDVAVSVAWVYESRRGRRNWRLF